MVSIWHQLLKLAYCNAPIANFVLAIGTVDALIGSFNDSGSLLLVGVGIVGLSLWLRRDD